MVDNTVSSQLLIYCRIQQQSALGPLLLLLIYINDVSAASSSGIIKFFADDSNVFVVNNDEHKLVKTANIIINELNDWFIRNILSINFDKTKYMIFKPNEFINNVIIN